MAVSGKIAINWGFSETSTSNTLGTATNALSIAVSKTFASGTATDQVDILWSKAFTLATGVSNDHDLAGALLTAFGATITAVEVVGIVVYNQTTTTGNYLTVGAGTNPWATMLNSAGTIKVGPDGVFCNYSPVDGFAVTAATGDILKVLNSGAASVTYQIGVIARSA